MRLPGGACIDSVAVTLVPNDGPLLVTPHAVVDVGRRRVEADRIDLVGLVDQQIEQRGRHIQGRGLAVVAAVATAGVFCGGRRQAGGVGDRARRIAALEVRAHDQRDRLRLVVRHRRLAAGERRCWPGVSCAPAAIEQVAPPVAAIDTTVTPESPGAKAMLSVTTMFCAIDGPLLR